MTDRNGKEIHEGEIVKILDRPDIQPQLNWAVFDVISWGVYTNFVLKNCSTNEFKIVDQEDIERSY